MADAEQLAEDALALASPLDGELVGPPLEQKARIGKGLIVHAEELFKPALSGGQSGLGQWLPEIRAGRELQFEQSGLAGLLDPQDAIARPFELKVEPDAGGLVQPSRAPVDDIVAPGRPAFAEKDPGDGVQQA